MEKYLDEYFESKEYYHLIPIMFLILVVPLIVRLKIIQLTGVSYDFWNGETQNIDFFSYYKSMYIIICASFSLLMLGIKSYQMDFKAIRRSIFYVPICTYSVFVILSSMFSKYPGVARSGFVDRYEGMYVIISYMIILFVTINLIKKEYHLKAMIITLFIGGAIIGIIGLFQYLGYDIWKSNFGRSLMIPSEYMKISDKLQFIFGKHTIYATLYHTDYVGSYMAMLFPLSLAIFMLCKNKILKIIMALLTVVMAINWLGCNSRAGMVGGFIAVVVLFIMMHKYISKNWKYFSVGFVVLIILFAGLNIMSKGYLGKQVSSLLKDTIKITQSGNVDKNIAEESIPLKDVKINGDIAEVITKTETLKFIMNNGQASFIDESNNPLATSLDNKTGKVTIKNNKYKDYQITIGNLKNKSVVQVVKGQIILDFDVSGKSISLVDPKGKPVSLSPIETWGFKGKEKLGSSRGYIWSRAIPLLKNTVIFGHGPDTFAMYFPQNDFKGKMYAYDGDMWQIVDKPHDLYLQTALNTGWISLGAMLSLFIMYIVSSAKIYFKSDFNDFTSIAGVGIFAAVCGYLGAGFFNDSIVSVAPVFWTLLGMGIAANYLLKPQKMANISEK